MFLHSLWLCVSDGEPRRSGAVRSGVSSSISGGSGGGGGQQHPLAARRGPTPGGVPRERLMQRLASGAFACLVCDYASSKRYHMTRHLRKHSGELFRCSLCSHKFYEKCQLVSHELRHYQLAAPAGDGGSNP